MIRETLQNAIDNISKLNDLLEPEPVEPLAEEGAENA